MNRRILLIILVLLLVGVIAGTASAQTNWNSYSLWFYDYWANKDLSGTSAASGSVGVINYDWGEGPPTSGMPSDGWSGRWTSYVAFEAGTYKIYTESDDGVVIFLGDKDVLTNWTAHKPTIDQVTVSLNGGTYPMAVSFFEEVGGAKLRVGWEKIGAPKAGAADVTVIQPTAPPPPPPPPSSEGAWNANYFNNKDLSGNAVYARSESAITHEWGYGSPSAGVVPNDNFSARWTRSVYFPAGSYKFIAQHDDGMRVSISGNRIIDSWDVQSVRTHSADVDLAAGTYEVVVEYFENTELATAKFWWETTAGGGTGTPTGVTATTTAYWLNFRTGPGTSFSKLGVLPKGTVLGVVGRNTNSTWLQVNNAGTIGWVSKYYTTVSGDLGSVPVTG